MECFYRKDVKTNIMLSGSMTVEAAFVMPIVILTVFALLYLAFFLHDKCRIQGVVNKTLHKASITLKHEADIATGELNYEEIGDRGVFYLLVGNNDDETSKLQQYLQQELSQGLFLTKVSGVDSELGKFKLKLTVNANTAVSLYWVKQLFKPYAHQVHTEECSVHNPAETLRRTEVLINTGSKLKGVDKLKEKLEGIFGK